MRRKLTDKEEIYLSNLCIAISQVLFGIAAVTFFTGGIDWSKVIVITLNLVLSFILWIAGWRLSK